MLCKGVGAENPWFPQTDLWRLLIHRMVFKPIEIVFKAHATSDRLPNSYIQQFDIQFQIFGFCIHDSTKPIQALHKEWLIYLISQVHNVQIYLDYHQFTKHQSFFWKTWIMKYIKITNLSISQKLFLFCELVVVVMLSNSQFKTVSV